MKLKAKRMIVIVVIGRKVIAAINSEKGVLKSDATTAFDYSIKWTSLAKQIASLMLR